MKGWTTHEMRVLKKIWESDKTIKNSMHLLPGRSYIAARSAMTRANFGSKRRGISSWVWNSMEKALDDSAGMTALELSEKIGCCYRQSIDMLRRAHDGDKVYIGDWTKSGTVAVEVWCLGRGKDAEKPGALPRAVLLERSAFQKRLKYHRSNPFAIAMMQVMEAA